MARWSAADRRYMQQALDLAALGQGQVEPNPMVGCVIVRAGRVVGSGFHRWFGGPHAEVHALRQAGGRARGATAYVTLEPCSHQGKTPPCADALIRAGVRRVMAAMRDPNRLVAGRGFRRLRTAGISVDVGLLRSEAVSLNKPFVRFHCDRRPFVILKWAQSIDGKIATHTGRSKWITSRQSRKVAHALRARVDAVIVGVDTVLADDPELTARGVRVSRIAWRIVLDTRLRTPLSARVVRTARRIPTMMVAGSGQARRGRRRSLESAGCHVLECRVVRNGIDLSDLMRYLHERQMTNVLVEGGGRVLGSFWKAGLADEVHVFVAPKLIGGETAPGPIRGQGPADLTNLPRLRVMAVDRSGPDVHYRLGMR